MTTTTTTTNTRSPRRRPAPSPRDQQIYLDYQSTGKSQTDLATQYGLTQCRISQIIRRVERWVQSSTFKVQGPQHGDSTWNLEPGTLNAAAFARRLEYERLSLACREAIRHFREPQKNVTHKTGTRGNTAIDETTERTLPPNLQCLKVLLQANAQLSRLEKQVAAEQTQPPTDQERREQVEAALVQLYQDAQRAGKLPFHLNPLALARCLVRAMLREPDGCLALHELSHAYGKKLVDDKPYNPQVPPYGGWYYAMHDGDGSLVAWISADQLDGAISPDYQPVNRSALTAIRVSGSSPPRAAPGDPRSRRTCRCARL
jgi:hypothetical protein